MTQDRIDALEARLQALEDEREIRDIVVGYAPLVDSGANEEVAGLWTEDGVYDVDEILMQGRDQLSAMVLGKGHQAWIKGGCAHFPSPPKIIIDGDKATAVSYSLMVVRHDGRFVVRRATASHWVLVRTEQGWKVEVRTSRVLDGRPEANQLLLAGARGEGTDAIQDTRDRAQVEIS